MSISTTTATVRGKGPREGFPDFIVRKLKGDRYGVLTGSVERQWKVGKEGQRIDPKWVSILHAPDPGWGIPCVGVDGDIRDAMFVATYAYEGTNAQTKFDPKEDQKTFTLQGNMGDRRIELHPRFTELKRLFGWDEAERRFPEFLPHDVSANNFLKLSGKAGQRSKLAFQDTWFFVGLTYRISYASQTIPDSILAKIGTLIKSPPNIGKFKLPAAAQERTWLVMAPEIQLRGNTAQINEEYLLSEQGGLPQAMYGFSQLALGNY